MNDAKSIVSFSLYLRAPTVLGRVVQRIEWCHTFPAHQQASQSRSPASYEHVSPAQGCVSLLQPFIGANRSEPNRRLTDVKAQRLVSYPHRIVALRIVAGLRIWL